MKLKLKLLSFFVLATFLLKGQPYGNEWINYSQTYYAFPVFQSGVYRISASDLSSAGFPLSSVDPRNIQLFARGQELAIHIEGESDGFFDATDFIEFYAESNDGFADAQLYQGANNQAHPSFSLFNDTIQHFITWNNSTSNKRLTPENDVNFSAYSTMGFVWKKALSSFNTTYYEGETQSSGATDPSYVPTEGWLDFSLNLGGTRTLAVATPRAVTSGPNAEIHWRHMGESNFAAINPDHHLNVTFAGTTFDTIYEGYNVVDKHFSVSPSNLGSSTTNFSFKSINDLGSSADRSAVSFIEVKYPHQLNFNNAQAFTCLVPNQLGQSKAYLSFTGFSASGSVWIHDLTSEKRILVQSNAGTHEALIPNGNPEKKCHIFSEGNSLSVSKLRAVNGNGSFTDFLQEERANGFVIVSHRSLTSSANQYAAYRNTKGHGAFVADIDELYLQFVYGINKHPYAIRNFINFISDSWTEKPQNLFLFGKSIKAHQCRKNAINFGNNLVPSLGNPASDISLTAGLDNNVIEPLLATGRLSANNTTEADWYLSKVMEYEGNSPKPWMKNILHFAGGKSGNEANRFISYLESYEAILSDTSFGGRVYNFRKNTTSPIQISLSDSIRNLINGGASIMTFFGHASTSGGFDQNIDDPQNYSNKGKYPLLVGNSCFTGDIHEDLGESVSEKFVIIKDKGVIAFLASVDLGFESKLNEYSRTFFTSLGQTNYRGTIGEHMINAIRRIEAGGNNFQNRAVALLMTLHGDPALVINSPALPDYEITNSQVKTDPEPVTTKSDSFELEIQVFNYGRAINDSLNVEIIRFYPDMSSEFYNISMAPVNYEGLLHLKLPVDPLKGAGYNRIDISLDPSNIIPEYNENNNFVSLNLYIKSGDLIPVMPYEFAVVPEHNVELKASTGYAFEEVQQYEIQLDTNDAFASPLETFKVTSSGGVITWQPNALKQMKDSLVYFWRARNTSGDLNSVWRSSSFQYIKGKRGWSQDHFHQFKPNKRLFLDMNEPKRLFEFSPSTKKLACQTASTLNFSKLGDILYKIDADLQEYGGCGLASAIHIAVLDSLTFEPWGTPFQGENPNHYFGQVNFDGNCGKSRVQNFFIFRSNFPSELAGLKDMLTTKIPNGNYVLAWTWVRNDFSNWDNHDPSLRGVFTALGADSIASISNDSMPYIFFVQKGAPQTAVEVIGKNYDEFIYLNASLKNNATYGNITSTIVGPSSSWDSLHWQHRALNFPQTDSLSLTMMGLAKDVKTVMANRKFKKHEKKNDISGMLNHESAPYMELDLYLSDNQKQTAAQLDRWTVLYEGVVDFALNAVDHFEFYNDTLQEGDVLKFSTSVKNISDYDSDSVLIRYSVFDKNRKKRELYLGYSKPLKSDSSLITSIDVPTLGLKGNNTLILEVNPELDQIEQHQFNNIGQIPFYVSGDNENPILDVTFDGVHILDGDIVSARPEIMVQLSDENPFLTLDDTSDFKVFMTDVQGQEKQRYFTNNNPDYSMEFIPAGKNRNKAKVEFRPILSQDGRYGMRVQATDRSNNESGDVDYRINFEVINKSSITNLMNYPNPFSTSTRFVFVLTGSKVPDNMHIQIMTISGKIVKDIHMSELGPIRIGRNITEYAWDGRDQYGDKLANGVYLYRVNTRLNGESIDHRSTSADGFFKQGFGKMVILR